MKDQFRIWAERRAKVEKRLVNIAPASTPLMDFLAKEVGHTPTWQDEPLTQHWTEIWSDEDDGA